MIYENMMVEEGSILPLPDDKEALAVTQEEYPLNHTHQVDGAKTRGKLII